jgi:hypothetical protein
MNNSYSLTAVLLALALASALGQPSPGVPANPAAPPTQDFSTRLQAQINRPLAEQGLTRFDLDFPGGEPKDLVQAIQKAMGRPVNAIVPDEFAATKLPTLKMKNVTVSQLFDALAAASRKSGLVTAAGTLATAGYYPSYPTVTTDYGFRTQGTPTDDSIWSFYVEKPMLPQAPPPPAKICRFYSLAPYLEGGVNVDDITTAIKTGWEMLGDTSPATIRFHRDTKLLIAVGEPSKLETIDAVLKALGVPKPKSAAPTSTPGAKSPEKL